MYTKLDFWETNNNKSSRLEVNEMSDSDIGESLEIEY